MAKDSGTLPNTREQGRATTATALFKPVHTKKKNSNSYLQELVAMVAISATPVPQKTERFLPPCGGVGCGPRQPIETTTSRRRSGKRRDAYLRDFQAKAAPSNLPMPPDNRTQGEGERRARPTATIATALFKPIHTKNQNLNFYLEEVVAVVAIVCGGDPHHRVLAVRGGRAVITVRVAPSREPRCPPKLRSEPGTNFQGAFA